MNLADKMCETSLAGTGGRPGPKINAWLKLLLIPVVTIGAGTDSRTKVGQELSVRSTTLDCVNASDKPTKTGAVNIP